MACVKKQNAACAIMLTMRILYVEILNTGHQHHPGGWITCICAMSILEI